MGSNNNVLPHIFTGIVVHGFGRGGKQLGCPTANLDDSAVCALPEEVASGVYWGKGKVEDGPEMGFVMSIGYNPQFNNQQKTMEVHFLEKLDDFYGKRVDGKILGFLREMKSFKSLDELVNAIEEDKRRATELLLKSPCH